MLEDCGHLEQEHFHARLSFCKSHSFLRIVEDVGFLHVFTIESAENQNLIFVHLSNTKTLASREALRRESDNLPGLLGSVIQAFYAVNVLLGCICDSTEHVYKTVLE